MNRVKLAFGLLIGASLLVGYEPAAEALPIASPGTASEISSADGPVVQVVTRWGVARRSTRRTARRVYRRHHWY